MIEFKSWRKRSLPQKILVMRFQAMGDTVITLPYLQDLKNKLPDVSVHFLTRREVSDIPASLSMFNKVIALRGGRNGKLQVLFGLLWMPYLWWQRYDVVIDLQNHRLSRLVRKMLSTEAWTQFDKISAIAAGERTRQAIDAAGIANVVIAPEIKLSQPEALNNVLTRAGWDGSPLVVLNPAGLFESRNWPLENYLSVAMLLQQKMPNVIFLMMGLPALSAKVGVFKNKLGERLIDLTGKTSPAEAYSIIRKVTLMLTEDSGLMHMAWTQRIPTVALLGSTRSDWSAPIGGWSHCFSSSDLPCGNCALVKCKYGDNHCLTRVTPDMVVAEALRLMDNAASEVETSR